jgi:hypothetical protein
MNKKILTLVVVGIVALPMAAAASTLNNHNVVTGHTTYANMSGFDPDIAAIAGLAESKVVWFNGQTIFSTLGSGFVYAASSKNPCSPLQGTDYVFQGTNTTSGYSLSFIDPNNQSHIVAHYTYKCTAGLLDQPNYILSLVNPNIRHHVWVTTTHAKLLDGPLVFQGNVDPGSDAGRWYNFALAVDTGKFRDKSKDGSVEHDGTGGRTTDAINSGDSYCEPENDHVCNEGSINGEDDLHKHNSATVNLYFSKEDKGVGAALLTSPSGTHPGTSAGCSADAHCNAVITGTYFDPTAGSP